MNCPIPILELDMEFPEWCPLSPCPILGIRMDSHMLLRLMSFLLILQIPILFPQLLYQLTIPPMLPTSYRPPASHIWGELMYPPRLMLALLPDQMPPHWTLLVLLRYSSRPVWCLLLTLRREFRWFPRIPPPTPLPHPHYLLPSLTRFTPSHLNSWNSRSSNNHHRHHRCHRVTP